jgi:uncharacterized membrane protein YhaH (DUF805 family)
VVGIETLVIIYLAGWLLVTPAVYVASRRWNDRRNPARHPVWVSVLAGALWPLLIVGLVEMSSIVVYTKAHSKPSAGMLV